MGWKGSLVYIRGLRMSRSHDDHSSKFGMRLASLATILLATAAGCAHVPTWPGDGTPGIDDEDPAPSGPAYLRAYKESHYRSLGSQFVDTLDWDRFARRLDDVDVLFLGDHHFDGALHERMLETIERLAADGRKLAIGVEAIGIQDEAALSLYMNGERDLDQLRDAIRNRWEDSWLDHDSVDASFYRRLLATARSNGARAFALEPTPRLPLKERDTFIGKRIRAVHGLMPDRLLVVVVGHAHLFGRGHLAERTGLRTLAVCARLSRTLLGSIADPIEHAPPETVSGRAPLFIESDAGILFFDPPTIDSPPRL